MSEKPSPALALLLLVPAPTLGTLAAMWFPATRGTAIGQGLYLLSKLWLAAFPLWWLRRNGQALSWSPPTKGGFVPAALLGVAVGALIIGVWQVFGDSLVHLPTVRAEAQANGLGNPMVYIGYCLYLALVNSLLEEYVWRWFVFARWEQLVSRRAAVLLAAVCFTLHHVFALAAQFGTAVTVLGSVGVCIGGAVWSWCYGRYRSVWPGYVSHLLVDAAIFLVGYQILFA